MARWSPSRSLSSGAKTINPLSWFRLSTRRGFDILRAVEQLILALIFIRAFGLGPLAGVLAIAVSDIGTMSKLFSEAIENTSEKPVDGVKASGGSRLQAIRFGTLPQALPVILSIILYQLESNTRSGTILGIVGAGGIGFLLADRISRLSLGRGLVDHFPDHPHRLHHRRHLRPPPNANHRPLPGEGGLA